MSLDLFTLIMNAIVTRRNMKIRRAHEKLESKLTEIFTNSEQNNK